MKRKKKKNIVAVSIKEVRLDKALKTTTITTKRAQSAEAEKQCTSSSNEIHKPQPELTQNILHQFITQKYQRFGGKL